GVLERCLVGTRLEASRFPAHHVARHAQHARGVAEGVAGLKAVRLRHADVLQRDLAVLDHLERDLVLDLLDAETGRGLVLDDEALDLVVGEITRPDDPDVALRRVADPSLLAVENPGLPLALPSGHPAVA